MYARVVLKLNKMIKVSKDIGRYYSHDHELAEKNLERDLILNKTMEFMNKQKYIKEGLNTTLYTVKLVEKNFLFTRIFVYYNRSSYVFSNKSY